jgi:tRNA A37 threonylcarbamoyladenosine biosynthesis protein TsaE
LQSSRDLAGLDLKKILADKKNLVIIEWPGLVKKILPRDTLWMDFESAGKNIRRVTF